RCLAGALAGRQSEPSEGARPEERRRGLRCRGETQATAWGTRDAGTWHREPRRVRAGVVHAVRSAEPRGDDDRSLRMAPERADPADARRTAATRAQPGDDHRLESGSGKEGARDRKPTESSEAPAWRPAASG